MVIQGATNVSLWEGMIPPALTEVVSHPLERPFLDSRNLGIFCLVSWGVGESIIALIAYDEQLKELVKDARPIRGPDTHFGCLSVCV